ncbi:polysaccharide deacetylase family protein [Clostridium brassicae]|uniref:Polysaccharide deacetylase family protein n=1 Tax=Clostridium brassicae TaxID=2999072 RepID=A0ABT4DAN4_9CLOT|nr:polysaccharide deacetylase family protein [Clostridium brassicae]MCY6959384.1 polysaccharide deacetylase family protein [Clostridium brassicae]
MIKKFGILCLILSSFLFLIACSTNNKSYSLKKESSNSISKTTKGYSKTVQSGLSNDKSLNNTTNNSTTTFNNNGIDTSDNIPVLMYHSIRLKKDNPLMVSPKKLDEQMKYLKDNGYYTLSLDELYDYFSKGKAIPKKCVVLTFDDGYVDNYTNLYPILKKYRFKGTIFVITGTIDNEKPFLTSSQLKELDSTCLDIQSHTVAHENLPKLSYRNQVKTLKNSKNFLEKKLNKKVRYLAYPYGKFNKSTIKAAEEAGYLMAFTTTGKWSNKSNNLFRLNRVYINGFFDLNTFIERVTNPDYSDRNNIFKVFWGQFTNFII